MIVGAAFCPQPPLLVPAVSRGAAGETAGLRAACREAIATVCAGTAVLLLGTGPDDRGHPAGARGSFAGFGVDLTVVLGRRGGPSGTPRAASGAGPGALPLSLAVGAWLLSDALGDVPSVTAWQSATGAAPPHLPDGPLSLLVMGDGSARRSTTAPGYLDERAAGFDGAVAAALAGGDPQRLADLDATLAGELLAAGVPAWHAAARLLAGRTYDAAVTYDDAPYGVGYFVATWRAA